MVAFECFFQLLTHRGPPLLPSRNIFPIKTLHIEAN